MMEASVSGQKEDAVQFFLCQVVNMALRVFFNVALSETQYSLESFFKTCFRIS